MKPNGSAWICCFCKAISLQPIQRMVENVAFLCDPWATIFLSTCNTDLQTFLQESLSCY